MSIIIINTTLNAHSKSNCLAQTLHTMIQDEGYRSEYIVLANHPIPVCDGGPSFSDANVTLLKEKIERANGIILASQIYNYDFTSEAKSLIEHTGSAWKDKPVGFVCSAGGLRSYMAPMGFANHLMLDFRCLINPRYVYATTEDYDERGVTNPEIQTRLQDLAKSHIRLVEALS